MGSNVLSAIMNIMSHRNSDLNEYQAKSHTRINAIGEALEQFLCDAYAGTFNMSPIIRDQTFERTFSYLGNQNNPPDFIVKGGEAVEIKKVEGMSSKINLNSSPPKNILRINDPRITRSCRDCESWSEKELIYIIGSTPKGIIKSLFFIQGRCWAADEEVYEKAARNIKSAVGDWAESEKREVQETKELGRLNRVDPLGITDLRIRGLWQISNPSKLYEELIESDAHWQTSISCLLTKALYVSYPLIDRERVEKTETMSLKNVQIKDPNNPARKISAVLLTGGWP